MDYNALTAWAQIICSIAGLILTACGIVFIARTLKEQEKTNREQAKANETQFTLLEIERLRAAREITPYLFLCFVDSNQGVYDRNGYGTLDFGYITRIYSLNVSKNLATDLCFEYFDLPAHGCYSEQFRPGIQIIPFIVDDNIELRIQFPVVDRYGQDFEIKLRLHYRDGDGRDYSKDYTVTKSSVRPEEFSIKTNHPGVNTLNLSDKDEYPETPSRYRHNKYHWSSWDSEPFWFGLRSGVQTKDNYNKGRNLRMFPLGINYPEQHQQMRPNAPSAQNPDLSRWEIKPFVL